MAKYGMLVDLTRCIGCHGCTVACQAKWDLLPRVQFTRVHRYETGTFPAVKGGVVTTQCMHCDDPPCARVCPTGATQKRADGIVVVDEQQCIGCRYCQQACPYDARSFNPERNIVQKCSFCHDFVDRGEKPACVDTCMAAARIFGDLEEKGGELAKAVASRKAVPIQGTSIYYVPPRNLNAPFLPAGFQEPGAVRIWQDIVRPGGKTVMGLAAGAVIAGLVINNIKGGGKNA